MSRYIQEFDVGIGGGTIQIPKCAKFLHLVKIGNAFRVVAEIWGDPSTKTSIEVRVFRKESYIAPELQYCASCVAGSELFHFFCMPADVVDLGSDGGLPPEDRTSATTPGLKAGGLKEI